MSKRDERVLIINDDGIDAYGIDLLEQAARRLFHDVWVVAPATHQSGKSRSISLGGRLELKQHGPQRFSVTGSPVDTLLTAMHALFQDKRPDIVLSGVNQGGNLGEDVGYSGTASAAMEAAMHGMRAFAFSQVRKKREDNWSATIGHLDEVLDRILDLPFGPECILNVNFPPIEAGAVTGWTVAPQGLRQTLISLENHPDGSPDTYVYGYERDNTPSRENSDIAACGRGEIAITPIRVTYGHDAALPFLMRYLDDKAPQ